jgi:DNA-binding response OmpR family regulator
MSVEETNVSGSILVADDDPEILTLVSRRLAKHGYTVYEAQDGLQALAEARAKKPDLIVLDVMMPGKNGWEVAKELRADPATKDIAILVLTAIGQMMNDMNSPLYGADDYIDKPFEFAVLEARVAKLLRGKRVGAAAAANAANAAKK